MDIVTIECSANRCKFKDNDGYYGICKNPKLQVQYQEFAGGRVKLSGCTCAKCEMDCGILPNSIFA